MKWFSLFLSFFLGKLNHSNPPSIKETIFIFFEEAAYRSRKPVVLILSGLACVLILCGGFFWTAIEIAGQFDRDGAVHASASAITGVVLIAISLGTFFWVFNKAWPGVKAKEQAQEQAKENPQQVSTLEHALSLLVMDFVKEREVRREERRERHPSHDHAPFTAENESAPPPYN